MQGRIAAVVFLGFIWSLVWLALAIVVIPDAVAEAADDDVIRVLLNIGISGTLLALPAYGLYRMATSGEAPSAPGAKATQS
jgi:hypothetical protein